jgi:ketosteroid isomerase-like protein
MDRSTLQAWLERYVEAWRSNDPEPIGALFTDDAEYRYHPFDEPIRGRDAIVASWLEEPDEPGTWRASYEPFAVDGDAAVAVGTSTYLAADGSVDRIYHNAYVMRFDTDGRCSSFTEWFILEPS